MKVIIDPTWSLMRVIKAAFDAYSGRGLSSRGFRMSVLMVWANVVGRERATREFHTLRDAQGGWDDLADMLDISTTTLRKVRKHFEAVPNHIILPDSSGDGDMTTLEDFSHLGSGGYGEVWRATDALGRKVAVKYMTTSTEKAQRTVLAHATPLALLGPHPNIVFIYHCNYLPHPTSNRHIPAMVMEYIEGETLRERLRRPIDLPTSAKLGDDLCKAITFIHSKGLIHGDLHEDNIMISTKLELKVIDLLNDRRLSEFTSGARRNGETDDTESLKAILKDILTRAVSAELGAKFNADTKELRDAMGIHKVFSRLTSIDSVDLKPSSLPAFLVIWNHIHQTLAELTGRPSNGRSYPIQTLIERTPLDAATRNEILELSKLRNQAVHMEPALIDARTVERALAIEEALRQARGR